MMQKLNVALVGCGYVANSHLKAWRKVKQAQVSAVCDLNEAMARNIAQRWKISQYYTSFSELLKNKDIDIIDISTPPQTHASLGIQAMEAGFNVLLEKPMTMTVKDAEQLVESQKSTGVKAGVIHNWLFEPSVREADSLVRKGLLGEVVNAEVEALGPKEDSMAANENHWCHRFPGGRFSEMLAHPIYLLRNFLGEIKVTDVAVAKVGDYSWMKSDEFCGMFKAGNKIGRVYASFNAPRDAIFINLYGKEAIIKLDIINSTVNVLPRRKTTRYNKASDALRQAAQLNKATLRNAAKIAFGSWYSGHEMYIKLFAESLANDTEPPVTVEEGCMAIKTLDEVCDKIVLAEGS
jgi:UDP-N-acetyl-2-amino-2-deoxyglucuronate dehydrogenase